MVDLVAKQKFVYVDESGDPDVELSKEGPSDYFVLSAIIIESDFLADEETKLREIIDRFFPRGQIKSSKIGSNISRRRKILDSVTKLNFSHYSQVIDKSLIISDSGLRFRKSFIKYINRILYKKLFESFSDIHVIADRYGRSEFMKGFKDYLLKRLPQRLFERSTFKFEDSNDYPFIQLADLFAGSINRCYSGVDPMDVLNIIRERTIIIDEWPPRTPKPIGYDELENSEKYDYLVRHRAVQQADSFVEKFSNSASEIEQAQVAAVKYLLYYFRTADPEEYIYTSKLQKYLAHYGFAMSEREIRQDIIAALRDHSVIIASNYSGIKLPYSVDDLSNFVSMVSSQTVPYLNRLEVCRDFFLLATNGELDIVDPVIYPELARYFSNDT